MPGGRIFHQACPQAPRRVRYECEPIHRPSSQPVATFPSPLHRGDGISFLSMAQPYSILAKEYDNLYEAEGYRAYVSFIMRALRENNIRAKSVLDVGCGTGRLLSFLPKISKRTGVDLSPTMLRIARKHVPNGVFHVSDITNMDLKEQFDVALCTFDVLNYVLSKRDLLKAMQTLERHVANGGLLIGDFNTPYKKITKQINHDSVSIASRQSAHRWIASINVKTKAGIQTEIHKERLYTKQEIEHTCKTSGFRSITWFKNFSTPVKRFEQIPRLLFIAKK